MLKWYETLRDHRDTWDIIKDVVMFLVGCSFGAWLSVQLWGKW